MSARTRSPRTLFLAEIGDLERPLLSATAAGPDAGPSYYRLVGYKRFLRRPHRCLQTNRDLEK